MIRLLVYQPFLGLNGGLTLGDVQADFLTGDIMADCPSVWVSSTRAPGNI